MSQSRSIGRAMVAGVSCGVALAICGAPSPVSAKESKRVICTAAYVAYKKAVEQEKAGHVHEARETLQACTESTCGGLVPKCRAFSEKLKAELPTIVPVVTDDTGVSHGDIQVKMDGAVLTSKLDGLPIAVEPGMHEFAFSTDGGVFATQKVLIVEGQRDRFITAAMRGGSATPSPPADTKSVADAKPAAKEPPNDPVADKTSPDEHRGDTPGQERSVSSSWALPKSPLPYIVGGVGVLGIAAGGVLTLWGNKDNSTLESTCSPYCKPSSQDHIKTMYILSDVSYGVGAAALAVSAFLFATSRSTESAEKRAPHEALAVGVQPIRSGGFASVSGAF